MEESQLSSNPFKSRWVEWAVRAYPETYKWLFVVGAAYFCVWGVQYAELSLQPGLTESGLIFYLLMALLFGSMLFACCAVVYASLVMTDVIDNHEHFFHGYRYEGVLKRLFFKLVGKKKKESGIERW